MQCVRCEYEAEKSFIVYNSSDIIHAFITHFLIPQDVSVIGDFRTVFLFFIPRKEAKPSLSPCLFLASEGCSCTNKISIQVLQSHPSPSSSPLSPLLPTSPLPTSANVAFRLDLPVQVQWSFKKDLIFQASYILF